MAIRKSFDQPYYDRYYNDPATAVMDEAAHQRLTHFVLEYANHLSIIINHVLDLGCGTGRWKKTLENIRPEINYTGVEVSEYACKRYGWIQSSASEFKTDEVFDLVVCQGVLQYLDDREVKNVLQNAATYCEGIFYLEVLTQKDWEKNCDKKFTDNQVFLRSGDSYRKILAPHFRNCGGGVFLARTNPAVLYEIEEL